MKHWPTKPLIDVATIVSSRVIPFEGKRRYIATGGLDGRDMVAFEEVDFKTKPSRADLVAKQDDVLLARMQATNKVALVTEEWQNYIWSTGFAALRPKTNLRSRFLMHYLASPFFQVDKDAHCTGATQKSLPNDGLRRLTVPVPPLAEQERIVKLLDEADELRKLRAQADRRSVDLIPALFHEMFGQHVQSPPVLTSLDGATAPRGWQWSLLTDVARLATGHTPSRRVPEYWERGNIPWISLTDIRVLDGAVAQATSESVTEKGIKNSSSVKLPKGTVCFSRTASVGFVTVMGREMCTSQDFVNWVCGDDLNPTYLMGALMQAREHLRSLASGSTHKTIYFPTVKQFYVLVPPLPLQQEFAQRVSEIRALQAAQAASRQRTEHLFQSMLHRAFNQAL